MLDFEPRNTYDIEVTDTFGGEANYCWVRRYTLTMPLANADDYKARKAYEAKIKREAKRLAGMTGVKGTWEDYGDSFTFRPRGACVVMFVDYRD